MRKLSTIANTLGLLFGIIIMLSCELGESPLGPLDSVAPTPVVNPGTGQPIIADSVTSFMRIFITPAKLLANNDDEAIVSVSIYNENHNPMRNIPVFFSSTHGIIEATDTTDSAGNASVHFLSTPVEAEAWIYARSTLKLNGRDTTVSVGRTITLYGLSLSATPSVPNALVGQKVPVAIELLDASGQAISNTVITLSGAVNGTYLTRGDGTFDTTITRSTAGVSTLTVSALGATDTASVTFWNEIPKGVATTRSIKELRIFSSRSQLKADNSDFALITSVLIDLNNNPVVGDTIWFKSDLGIIDRFGIVDTAGRATVTLQSSPVNDTCTIWAYANTQKGKDSVSTQITFAGVKLFMSADPLDLKTGQYSTIEALLKDASGNPVGGFPIDFQVKNGTFQEGTSPYRVTLNPSGKAVIHVTSASSDTVKVWASANNSEDSISLVFTAYTLSVSASPRSITADGFTQSTITAVYRDGFGNPVPTQTIRFATNAGTISPASVSTNASGIAQTTLTSADFATRAIVQANAPSGQAQDTVTFKASTAAAVTLSVTPDNVGTNGGSATLIAVVTDANGNMVSREFVNFKIINGPGGGEFITKPVVVTQDGIARSTLLGGSLPSSYRGCEVVARIGSVADTTKLTISGEPYIITVSRPEDDTTAVSKGGILDETTMECFVGAVVQDINGNPVADNTQVHFSAVVSGLAVLPLKLDHWAGIGSSEEIKAVLSYRLIDNYFEDINNNRQMDANIDLMLDDNDNVARRGDDVNGDGVCDYRFGEHDFFWDFNGNGVPDTSSSYLMGNPGYNGEPYYHDAATGTYWPAIFADLNQNGKLDLTEFDRTDTVTQNVQRTRNPNSATACDLPASRDFRFSKWEMRLMWRGERFNFEENDFAVAVDASASTKDGVAYARLTYPRQFCRRLIVTVNAEANGIRDKDGERFVLPQIK